MTSCQRAARAADPARYRTSRSYARDNSASAPGGANALLNYFHVYIINPNKPNESVNVAGAQALVSFLTSPSFQASLRKLPRLARAIQVARRSSADASPAITASAFPSTVPPTRR